MSRVLKFRAWDMVNKKWLFGYDYKSLGGFSLIGETVLLGELNSIPLEKWNDIDIMQYTGLKDINEKEVYEGDIVTDYIHGNGQVLYRDGAFMVMFPRMKDISGQNLPYGQLLIHTRVTVLGNVSENKELLEEVVG